MAEGEEEGESELAYLKMPAMKYYPLTLVLYAVCVIAAIFVDDLGLVFELVGAFAVTGFILPSLMYLIMIRNPRAFNELETPRQRLLNKIWSFTMIAFNISNMILVILKQIFQEDESAE